MSSNKQSASQILRPSTICPVDIVILQQCDILQDTQLDARTSATDVSGAKHEAHTAGYDKFWRPEVAASSSDLELRLLDEAFFW